MRHVTTTDLDRLEPLLAQLRRMSALRERTRGVFTRKSRAFLHFHVDGDELFADIRLADEFERHRVTTAAERDQVLNAIKRTLERPD
jgi:aerobic-type carbon monoxide dehydrogenase small subunit (CoxS/CutS family)